MSPTILRVGTTISVAFVLVNLSLAQMREGKFGIGFSLSGNKMASDLPANDVGVGASLDYTYAVIENWSLRGSVALDGFKGKNGLGEKISSSVFTANFAASYEFLPTARVNPFAFLGFGLLYLNPVRNDQQALIGAGDQPWDVALLGGFGVDYFVDPIWSVTLLVRIARLRHDKLEGIRSGSSPDSYLVAQIGFRYYLYDFFSLRKALSPSNK